MDLGPVISVAVPAITFVLMTVVGSDLTWVGFRRVGQHPRLVWAGLLVPPLALPPLALALIALFDPPPVVAMGLLLMASCPVGGISNTFTFLAGGTTTLSIVLTALSCLLAAATMPAVSVALGWARHDAIAAAIPPVALVGHLIAAVALPASLGLVARARWPAATERLRPSLARLAYALLVLLIALIVLDDVEAFVRTAPYAVPLAIAFILCGYAVGAAVAVAAGAERPDRIALATEFATRNVAVATMAAVTVAGRTEFAVFGTTYFLTEVPVMLAVARLTQRAAPGSGRR
jgi:BASS family bile acid:Na+ symporter